MKFVLSLLFALLPLPALAQQAGLPQPPVLAARAYVLYDATSNQLLAASQTAHEHIAPGALVKLMTAYVAFNAIKQHQFEPALQIHPSLSAIGPRSNNAHMFLDRNKAVSIEELLHGLIVLSANDAARALAELISGDEKTFAGLMNQNAQSLGMADSHFTNATGQPDAQQYSSAYDLILLAAAMVRDFPQYYGMFGLHDYSYNGIRQFNNNRLLWDDPFVDGMMRGQTSNGGYNLVASNLRDSRRLISVVAGVTSDSLCDSESQKLLNYGFRYFETVLLYKKNQAAASVRIWKGAKRTVDVGFPQGLSLTAPKGSLLQIKASMETQQPIIAPIKAGQRLGTLKLSLDGKPYAEFPLAALQDVPLANVFSRGWDALRLMLQ